MYSQYEFILDPEKLLKKRMSQSEQMVAEIVILTLGTLVANV